MLCFMDLLEWPTIQGFHPGFEGFPRVQEGISVSKPRELQANQDGWPPTSAVSYCLQRTAIECFFTDFRNLDWRDLDSFSPDFCISITTQLCWQWILTNQSRQESVDTVSQYCAEANSHQLSGADCALFFPIPHLVSHTNRLKLAMVGKYTWWKPAIL